MNAVVMPFGKHRGCPLPAVPTAYLDWCLRASKRLSPWLREAIEGELRRRLTGEPPPRQEVAWPEVLQQWYRQLALEFHPDRGGSDEAMRAILAARDLLWKLLEERDEG
jgi:hypothetical protein